MYNDGIDDNKVYEVSTISAVSSELKGSEQQKIEYVGQVEKLPALSQLATSFGLILSLVTIVLLYLNYVQQRTELSKLISQNKQANELQIILNEKQDIDSKLNELREKLNGGFHRFTNRSNEMMDRIIGGMDYNHPSYNTNANSLNRERNVVLKSALNQIDNQIKMVLEVVGHNSNVQLLSNSFSVEFKEFLKKLHSNEIPGSLANVDMGNRRRNNLQSSFTYLNEIKDCSESICRLFK